LSCDFENERNKEISPLIKLKKSAFNLLAVIKDEASGKSVNKVFSLLLKFTKIARKSLEETVM
jgi:hypothetical protein